MQKLLSLIVVVSTVLVADGLPNHGRPPGKASGVTPQEAKLKLQSKLNACIPGRPIPLPAGIEAIFSSYSTAPSTGEVPIPDSGGSIDNSVGANPMFSTKCLSCHNGVKQVRLISKKQLEQAQTRVEAGTMPPEKAPKLTAAEKTDIKAHLSKLAAAAK